MRWLMVAGVVGAGAAHAASPPVLRQVVLSTSGTGQFVFDAEATGADVLPLDVKLDQVDDLLKSLVVDDPAGHAASVRLPGREPLSETFRTLPFAAAAFASPEALLGALVGEAVSVPSPGAPGGVLSGTVLAVTAADIALPNNGGTLTRHRLTLATATGLASVVLEDAGAVDLASAPLRAQIGTALAAIAAGRVQDRRTLSVVLGQGGPRTVRMGYVVATPVWKASWRLELPPQDGPATGPRLHGFAVVENLSGRDWNGVDITLTSGQPVLYRQSLYDPVFTERPDAPVDVPNRLTPEVDAGAVEARAVEAAEPPPPSPALAPAPARMRALAAPQSAAKARDDAPPSAAVEAGTAQVRYHLAAKVDAPAGQSLLLPIVDRVFPGRRVALFRFGSGDTHPLVALLLRNDTDGALPPGLATVYEAGSGPFVGDARLPAVQPGEERLLSFAADLPVTIDAQAADDTHIASVRAARGVLDVQLREQAVTTYRIVTPAGTGRTVLIEQPRRPGWTLMDQAGTTHADTPTHHRVTVEVPAGATQTVRVVLERRRGERVVVADMAPAQWASLSSDGETPQVLRDALARAAALRTESDRATAMLGQWRTQRDGVAADQRRVRDNLAAVPAGDQQRRYLAQLQRQEDEIARLDAQIATAQKAADTARAALADYLAALSF